MSLYGFGKLRCTASVVGDVKAWLAHAAEEGSFVVVWDAVDDGDRETLDSVAELRGHGLYYALSSSDRDHDATQLWMEVTTGAAEPRLGRAIAALVSCPGYAAGGLALVDGSIDAVFRASPDECVRQLLSDALTPWDRSANRLYVWCRAESPSP